MRCCFARCHFARCSFARWFSSERRPATLAPKAGLYLSRRELAAFLGCRWIVYHPPPCCCCHNVPFPEKAGYLPNARECEAA